MIWGVAAGKMSVGPLWNDAAGESWDGQNMAERAASAELQLYH
jgi:hypothetical protein